MKKQKKLWSRLVACAIACVILCTSFANPVRADIFDNAGNAVLEQTIGSWSDTEQSHSVIGLLRLIISKISAFDTKLVALDEKIDTQTRTLQSSIENIGQSVNASHNLYVYIPKSITQSNYAGQQISITSTSGNQHSVATLRDDGTNYSTTLYFNFNGACRVNFNVLGPTQACAVELPVTINAAGQEQQLWQKGQYTTSYPMDFVHDICQGNRATEFFNAGDLLSCGWNIVTFGADDSGKHALKLWRKVTIGSMGWVDANSTAQNYWSTFNSENCTTVAFKSCLLSKEDAESDWMVNNRHTYKDYWLETLYSTPDWHYYIYTNGSIGSTIDRYSNDCFPAVWIH